MEESSMKSRSPPAPVAETFIKSECSLAPLKKPVMKTEDELVPVTEVFIKSECVEVPMEEPSMETECELAPVEEVFLKSESVQEPEAEHSDESINAPETEPLCNLECLQGEVLLEVPTTYQLIEGGNKKGGHLLVDSVGYTYSKKRQSSVSIMWSCRIGKKCQATVRQPIGTQDFIRGPKPHNHTGTPGAALKSKIRAQVRAAARQDLFSYSSAIISKVMETVDFTGVDACTQLPNRGALLRQANRARENLRPKHPSDLNFTLDVNAIPYDFFQKDIKHKGQRHIILASHMQLEILSKAKVWFLDSSIRATQEPFKQLFSMHTFLESESVISQVPLCFVYMSRCKAADYKLVIKEIISLIPSELVVKEVVLNFDKSMWLGVQGTLPEVSVHGCWFRWAQTIFHRVKECGLQTAYVHKPQVRDLIRLLMALPNLPALHIPHGFNQLKKKCPPDNLELNRLFSYIESTWIGEESRPPHLWSTFHRAVRTYNDADGWHDGLYQNVKSNTLNMYRLFSMLHDEASKLPQQISPLDLEELRSHLSKQVMHKQFALEQLWTQFEDGCKTVIIHKYLRQCSELCDHPEDDT
ncbi:uncharacterized protein [Palaemon carinicauda]|uniref:uncharacterized protein n=1 Tax=Palaemon carinicauda TaxID=392227 RepID=UPI0035B65D70